MNESHTGVKEAKDKDSLELVPDVKPPVKKEPDKSQEFYGVWKRTKMLLQIISDLFSTNIILNGVGEDNYAQTLIAAAIEKEIASFLNLHRQTWDPNNEYLQYRFEFQERTFPDILLRKKPEFSHEPGRDIAFGIEIKTYYIFSKEGQPTSRYKVTEKALTDLDIFLLIPWYFNDMYGGKPELLTPFVDSARYIAQLRNYYWEHVRETTESTRIIQPEDVTPYPLANMSINDKPESDNGSNFGRIGRGNLEIEEYLKRFDDMQVRGKTVRRWREYLREVD